VTLALAALMGATAAPARRVGGPAAALIAAGLILLAINVSMSIQWLQSIRTLAMFAACALTFVFCARRVGGPAEGRGGLLQGTVIAAGVGLALFGVYQSVYRFGRLAAIADAATPEAIRARIESGRAVATLGLPAALAGVLIMTLPLTAAWTWRVRGRDALRAVGLILCAVQAAGLLAARSAAAVASLAIAAAAVAWLAPSHEGGAAGPRRRWLAAGLAVAGVVLAGGLLLSRMLQAGAVSEGAGPFALRLGNWKVATEIFSRHPLFGAGLGCYGIAFPQFRQWGMNESRYAHNSYMQLLSEGGLALGIPAMALALLVAVLLLRRARDARRDGDLSVPLASAGCVAFLAHNLVDFTLYIPTVALAFCCIAGPILGARRDDGRPPAAPRAMLAVAGLLLAAVALGVTRGDMALDEARSRAVAGDAEAARLLARTAARHDPLDPEPHSFLSQLILEDAGDASGPALLEEAEREALRAVYLDPETPHRWHLLGRVRLAASDPQGAFIALTRAADLYPIRIEYRQDRDAVAAAIGARRGAP